jgi:alkanesulfonate monooxygenase SsuD/methylene tetrahydromethanopterin reductase-like flavin-dependent oxidoreductase (luciferase family)
MTTTTTTDPATAPAPRAKQRLGFNTRVSFDAAVGAAAGLRDGIELFRAAEGLGLQSGWVYQRHFDHYLSSPLPFLSAVGQHTTSISLGTAVLPMRYQEPVLLAEAAGVTDLLVGGRLQLALSAGATAAFDAVFGAVETDARTEAQHRLRRFLDAVEGRTLHTVDGPDQGAPLGTELRVTPHSPGLRARLRQGVASVGSAEHAADLGLGIICGTVLHGLAEGETFPEHQARVIAAYRARWAATQATDAPPVAVAASVLPGTTPDQRALHAAYDHQRRTEGMAASRPAGALTPVVGADLPAGMRVSPSHHGTPDEVAAAVLADPGISGADELVLFLPPAFTLPQNVAVLTALAQEVAPALGWTAT